jgi:hypothetical protein
MARRWREVTMEELRRVWEDLARRKILYSGCTHAELVRIYGAENIKHRMGYGWYKLTEK